MVANPTGDMYSQGGPAQIMKTNTGQALQSNDPTLTLWRRFVFHPLVRVVLALLWVVVPFLVLQRVVPLLPLGKTSISVPAPHSRHLPGIRHWG
jgi:hypothetical protein